MRTNHARDIWQKGKTISINFGVLCDGCVCVCVCVCADTRVWIKCLYVCMCMDKWEKQQRSHFQLLLSEQFSALVRLLRAFFSSLFFFNMRYIDTIFFASFASNKSITVNNQTDRKREKRRENHVPSIIMIMKFLMDIKSHSKSVLHWENWDFRARKREKTCFPVRITLSIVIYSLCSFFWIFFAFIFEQIFVSSSSSFFRSKRRCM